jgi:hypothetical protein
MNGFISYCHSDRSMFDEFGTHLKSVERMFDLKFWADTRIRSGASWNSDIEKAISRSDVFILMASPAFIASDYIFNTEIPAINKRYDKGALILPVILKRCAWQIVTQTLQAAPSDSGRLRPIEDWKRRSDGYDLTRVQIGEAIGSYLNKTPTSIVWGH